MDTQRPDIEVLRERALQSGLRETNPDVPISGILWSPKTRQLDFPIIEDRYHSVIEAINLLIDSQVIQLASEHGYLTDEIPVSDTEAYRNLLRAKLPYEHLKGITIYGEDSKQLNYVISDYLYKTPRFYDEEKSNTAWEKAIESGAPLRSASFTSNFLSAYHGRKVEVKFISSAVEKHSSKDIRVYGYVFVEDNSFESEHES